MKMKTKTNKTSTKKLTFRALGCKPISGLVKNPDATLGQVSAKVAAKMGIAGVFECLDPKDNTLSPYTRLADLPDEEITLSTDLTPA
jgi:hypothetical protein